MTTRAAPEEGPVITAEAALGLDVLAARPVGQGFLAYPVRLLVSLEWGRGGVAADPALFSADWLQYARTALEAASRLEAATRLAGGDSRASGGSKPGAGRAPGLKLAPAAPPDGRPRPELAQLTGGSASLPLALAVLCLLRGIPWPPHLYASGVLSGPDGRLYPGNPAALSAKVAALDRLAQIGGFRFRLLHAPSAFRPPRDLRGETTAVPGLAGAAQFIGGGEAAQFIGGSGAAHCIGAAASPHRATQGKGR